METNVYITKERRKKELVTMIFSIIGGVLLIVSPFMNFGTMHFKVEFGAFFSQYLDSVMGETEPDEEVKDKTLTIDYGFDMFQIRKLGANYTEFGKLDYNETEDWKTANREAEDFIRYDLDLEGIGVGIEDDVYDELFGIIGSSVYAYNALCIVPYVILGVGILIIIFASTRHYLPGLICSLIAVGGIVWLISCMDRFWAIVGLGGYVLMVGLAVCVISSMCGLITKK